jgi:phage FluMu protein Com
MPIEFRCSRCGKLLRTDDDTAGRMAQCPECGGQTQVPAHTAAVLSPSMPSSAGGGPFAPQGAEHGQYAAAQGPYQTAGAGRARPIYPADPAYALRRVSGPAVCLIITAVLGIGFGSLRIFASIMQFGIMAAMAHRTSVPALFIGPVGTFAGAVEIVMGIIILLGAVKMKDLENYGLAIAASVIAMIPCISPCCMLGLPFGIWALVVLSDPVVKASFKS